MNLNNQKIKNKNLEINIVDLPKSEFKISINEDIIKTILKDIKIKNYEFYNKFSKLKSQKAKKIESIKSSFFINWKKGKRIPIDCFELICKLNNKNILDYQKDIENLFFGSSKTGWNIKFPIKLNKDLFLISEAIRTEGCIVKGKNKRIQGVAISNKDVYLLSIIEKTLNNLNINSGFSRILHIILYLDENNISKITNSNNKELHFHFNNGRLEFLELVNNYKFENEYNIFTKDGIKYLKVKITNNILGIESDFKATSYLSLQVYNSVFARFLGNHFKIPYGIGNNKTYSIDLPFNINQLSEEILKTILDIVISCEGCIFCGNGDRFISIKIASKRYLEKIRMILKRFDIDSNICNSNKLYILYIRRKSNLNKLFNLIKLTVNYKQEKLKEALSSYSKDRIPHYEAKFRYLTALQTFGPINLKELSVIIDKKYNSLIVTFGRLEMQGYVIKYGRKFLGTKTTPWIYQISEKGSKYINHECTKR